MLAPPLCPTRKSGTEPFHREGVPQPFSVQDFWAWSASDLISNAIRGRLAEFIVAQALGVAGGVRSEWDAYDLKSHDGITVEVKSAAYVQTWAQEKPSSVVLRIGATHAWSNETREYDVQTRRQAMVYVFALLHCQDRDAVDALALDQWRFFVLATTVLNEKLPEQRSVGLKSLEKLGAKPCRYDGLAEAIRAAAR